MNKKFGIIVLAALLAAPAAVQAQGLVNGAERGAREGDRAAGPLGGIVGGAVGAATGTVGGILGVDERPRFHDYVVREHRPSYRFDRSLRVGEELPTSGVTYYEVPPEYRVNPRYRYAVLNDHPVLVDPLTHRIVEILD